MDLSKVYSPDEYDMNRSELDSHADSCGAGSNTTLLWFTDHNASVSPFIGEYKPLRDIPIATVAAAWDDPTDGSTLILVINEALYFGDWMPYSLLCPNQLRHNGLIVNDIPRAFDFNSSHSIIIPNKVNLPLKTRGVMSYLPTRKPTDIELSQCERFELTSVECWPPHKLSLDGADMLKGGSTPGTSGPLYTRDPIELDGDLTPKLIQALQTTPCDEGETHHQADIIAYSNMCRDLQVFSSDTRQSVVTKEFLSQCWFIGLEAAKHTLLATTQEGMRYVDRPTDHRLRTGQAHLRFPSLIFYPIP